MQEDSRNSPMNARYYSAPSHSVKELYQMYKNKHLYIKVEDISWLSLIEKLISSAIVCDKLRLKWIENTLGADKSNNHNLYGEKGLAGVDKLWR